MNFKGNFTKIGEVDISKLKEKVQSLGQADWEKESWRQEHFKAHQSTQTISLIFDKDFRHQSPTILPELYQFEEELKPVFAIIKKHYNKSLKIKRLYKKHGAGYFVRISLVNLLSESTIPKHMDRGFSLTHAHRIHLPIVTSDKVLFSVGGEEINMREGEIWEINNRREHGVENFGNDTRAHFILDWVVPGESCCCSRIAHPQIPCSPEICVETDTAGDPCTCYLKP